MIDQDIIKKLRADAANCARLAKAASDPEAGEALRQIANDVEAAIDFFEGRNAALDGGA
jgi:hypothetical protein